MLEPKPEPSILQEKKEATEDSLVMQPTPQQIEQKQDIIPPPKIEQKEELKPENTSPQEKKEEMKEIEQKAPQIEKKEEIKPEYKITLKKNDKIGLKPKDRKKGLKTGQDLFNYYAKYEARKYKQAERFVSAAVKEEKERKPNLDKRGWAINDSKLNDEKFVKDLIFSVLDIIQIKGEERLKISEFINRQIEAILSENSLLHEYDKVSKAGALQYVLCKIYRNEKDLFSNEEIEKQEKLIEDGKKLFNEFKEKYLLTDPVSKQTVLNVIQKTLKIADQNLKDGDFDRNHQWDYSTHQLIERKWDEKIDGQFWPNRKTESSPAKKDLQMLAVSHFVESLFDEKDEDAVSAYLVDEMIGMHKQIYIHYDNNGYSLAGRKLAELLNAFNLA